MKQRQTQSCSGGGAGYRPRQLPPRVGSRRATMIRFLCRPGVYQSLRVTIGKGEGHNWWCVIFPSLCVPATADGFADAAAAGGFTDAEISLMTRANGAYVVKFRSLNCFRQLKKYLVRGMNAQRGRDAGSQGLREFECCKFWSTLKFAIYPLRYLPRKCRLLLSCRTGQEGGFRMCYFCLLLRRISVKASAP